jgi:hypothetical protein
VLSVTEEKIIAIRQIMIDSLEIVDGFPKKMWGYCTFIKEDYFKKREEEKKDILNFEIEPKKIVPRKLYLRRKNQPKVFGIMSSM